MEFKDYYAILGVTKEASQGDIQRAYRKLARRYHPDINKSADAEEKFKDIGEAYEVLKDPEKRAQYDRYGMAWKAAREQGGTPPPGYEDVWVDGSGDNREVFSDFSAFFEQLFGGGGRRRDRYGRRAGGAHSRQWQWVSRGEDREVRLDLTLEEAARGGQRELTLSDPSTGRRRTYKVNIPSGVTSGQRIRLAGQGGPGSGGAAAGDLYLRVHLLPHKRFRLEGKNLYTTLPVTPWEAVLGAEVTLPTLDGTVNVKVPPGSPSGRKIRLRGKGFPDAKGREGDLYAELRMVVPPRLSDEERRLFKKLAKVSRYEPRAEMAGGGV